MGKPNKIDLLTIVIDLIGLEALVERSGSPVIKMGFGALVRKVGTLATRVAEVPQLNVGNIRFTASRGSTTVWVVEIPSGVYSISDNGDEVEGNTVRRQIALPWMYLILNGDVNARDYVYCSGARVKNIDSSLYISPLPNSSNGHLCLGDNVYCIRADREESVIAWKVRMFFDAPFNTGYTADAERYREEASEVPENLAAWEARTALDPSFIDKLTWLFADTTVRMAMSVCLTNSSEKDDLITVLMEG